MNQPDLGKALAGIRRSKGLTQTELSEECNITVKTIQRIESGRVTPRSYTVKTISQALGVDFLAFSESSYETEMRVESSKLRWLRPVMKQVAELFNLKTNTMKKVTYLTIILGAIGLGLFMVIPDGRAQDEQSIDYSKFTEMHSRGIIFFYPKREQISISNVKDTADYRISGDLIQEYENKIFLNADLIGRAFNSDTVLYQKGKLLIKSTYWTLTLSGDSKEMNYLIPAGVEVDDIGKQFDTTDIYIGDDHIREFDFKIFLNGDFLGQVNLGDTIVYNHGEMNFISLDDQ